MGKITTKKRILFSFRGQVTINGQIMSEKPGIFCAQNGQKLWVFGQPAGRGIGRKIIETLEQDEYFLRAKRIEIPASITGTPFYRKMGYDYKNGICTPDEEGLLRLEKYR